MQYVCMYIKSIGRTCLDNDNDTYIQSRGSMLKKIDTLEIKTTLAICNVLPTILLQKQQSII